MKTFFIASLIILIIYYTFIFYAFKKAKKIKEKKLVESQNNNNFVNNSDLNENHPTIDFPLEDNELLNAFKDTNNSELEAEDKYLNLNTDKNENQKFRIIKNSNSKKE